MNTRRSPKRLNQRIGIISLAVIGIGLAWLFRYHGYDDPFITFRYAYNFSRGLGLVYNPDQKVLSTTTPLYALLVGTVNFLGFDIPVAGSVISVLSLVAGGACLYLWLSSYLREEIAWCSGLSYILFPQLLGTVSSEISLYLLTILISLWSWDRKRYRCAAIAAALTACVRPDGLLVTGFLGILLFVQGFRHSRVPTELFYIVGILGAWFMCLTLYYGAPWPVSLTAKQHQGAMSSAQFFLPRLLQTLKLYGEHWFWYPWGVLSAVGLFQLLRNRWTWPLVGWTSLYIVAYTLLRVRSYGWYYAPLTPLVIILMALGWSRLTASFRLIEKNRLIFLGMSVLILWAGGYSAWWLYFHPDTRLKDYRVVGEYLDEHTPVNAQVGLLEVGIIGYYSKRPVVDFAGLIQPEIAQILGPKTGYEQAAEWALLHYQPEFIVVNPDWFRELVHTPLFQDNYRIAYQWEPLECCGGRLWLYARE